MMAVSSSGEQEGVDLRHQGFSGLVILLNEDRKWLGGDSLTTFLATATATVTESESCENVKLVTSVRLLPLILFSPFG